MTASDKMTARESARLDFIIKNLGKVFVPIHAAADDAESLVNEFGWDIDYFDLHAAAARIAKVYAVLVQVRDTEREKEGGVE